MKLIKYYLPVLRYKLETLIKTLTLAGSKQQTCTFYKLLFDT